jgi:hypothetical protein
MARSEDAEDRLNQERRALARGSCSSGRWEAPYWFVGIEPGGDELDACI